MEVPRKRSRRKDARPQELIAAALEAFSRNGFAGTKIEDIAELAGVAKGTVYLYFETKDALFEAVVRENISPIFARLTEMTGVMPSSAGEMLSTVIEHVYRELIDCPARRVIMQILIGEGSRFPQLTAFYYNEVIARGKQILRKIIKHGIDTGEFRATQVLNNPEVIMGPAIMAAVWKMTFEQASPLNLKQFLAAHLDVVLNGLKSESPIVGSENAG
jgi:AcrR family transcriptional regulator